MSSAIVALVALSDTLHVKVALDSTGPFILLQSLANLLEVEPRSITNRLKRAGLDHLILAAPRAVEIAFKDDGICSKMDRAVRVLEVSSLSQFPEGFGREQSSRLADLSDEVAELVRETPVSLFAERAALAPESPKDKAARKAILPGLKMANWSTGARTQFNAMKSYYMSDVHRLRQGGKPLSEPSFAGIQRTVMAVFGYMVHIQHKKPPGSLAAFLDIDFIMEMLNTRMKPMKPASKAGFARDCVAVAKFLTSGKTKDKRWGDIKCVKVFREAGNTFYSEWKSQKKLPEDLIDVWVPMETLRELLAEFYEEFLKLRPKARATDKDRRKAAQAEGMYIALGMFVVIPTLRSRAIRLLQINTDGASQNLLVPTRRGTSAKIIFKGKGSYKTWDTYGDMEIEIPPFFSDQIRDYIKAGRKNLLRGKHNSHLVITSQTKPECPMDESAFSCLIKRCTRRVTDKPISAHALRDMA